MYLDAVVNENIKPVFNASPHDTIEWLKRNKDVIPDGYQVCVGRTLEFLSVDEYLAREDKAVTDEKIQEA
jgi:hypothetical protein